jgi:hypothetical protein
MATQRVTLRIPPEFHEKIKECAAYYSVPVSSLVTLAMVSWIETTRVHRGSAE